MSWTYDPQMSTERDQVRFLVRDTDSTRQIFQDEEVDWTLTQEANIYMAAAALCDQMSIGAGRGIKRKKVGELTIEYDPAIYSRLSNQLRSRGSGHQLPYAGGTSIADKAALQADTDWVQPAINKGQGDNPQAPSAVPPAPQNPLTSV